jgi:hypothetical protein
MVSIGTMVSIKLVMPIVRESRASFFAAELEVPFKCTFNARRVKIFRTKDSIRGKHVMIKSKPATIWVPTDFLGSGLSQDSNKDNI